MNGCHLSVKKLLNPNKGIKKDIPYMVRKVMLIAIFLRSLLFSHSRDPPTARIGGIK
jgi:hypothetical protein